MWDYRIVKRRFDQGRTAFEICEVYYDDKGPFEHSSGVAAQGVEFEELKADFKLMSAAFSKPVLQEIKLPSGVIYLREMKKQPNIPVRDIGKKGGEWDVS